MPCPSHVHHHEIPLVATCPQHVNSEDLEAGNTCTLQQRAKLIVLAVVRDTYDRCPSLYSRCTDGYAFRLKDVNVFEKSTCDDSSGATSQNFGRSTLELVYIQMSRLNSRSCEIDCRRDCTSTYALRSSPLMNKPGVQRVML